MFANRTLTHDFFITNFTALMNAINAQDLRNLIGILGSKHLAAMNTIIDSTNGTFYTESNNKMPLQLSGIEIV
tara:strand:+ start:7168 stop:7386 length:219 start_codon:yes stop_codon:yes gene_type:complete